MRPRRVEGRVLSSGTRCEFGERRKTTYRMSRQVALERYPDARAVPGTMEIRNLPDSDDEQPYPLR